MGQLSNTGSTGGGMHHSHSTPAGVDGGARTPPATPKKGGKMLAIRVQMLDDTVTIFQVQVREDYHMNNIFMRVVNLSLHTAKRRKSNRVYLSLCKAFSVEWRTGATFIFFLYDRTFTIFLFSLEAGLQMFLVCSGIIILLKFIHGVLLERESILGIEYYTG